jgi:hypothetical protein
MQQLASPRLLSTTRPSKLVCCVGSKKPLILSAKRPVAPLMNTGPARALSPATARATAVAWLAPCAFKRVTWHNGGRAHAHSSSRSPVVPLRSQSPSSRSVDPSNRQNLVFPSPLSMCVKLKPPMQSHLEPKPCIFPCPCLAQVSLAMSLHSAQCTYWDRHAC